MPTKFNVFTNSLDIVNDVGTLVVGPAISTDNAVVRWDGTTGLLVQNSGTTLSDADVLTTSELILTTDLAIAHGGSARSTATAFAVICGGTTSTGAHQSAGLGSTGQVLTSQGSGTLPIYTSVAGTGDVTAAANMTDNAVIRGDGGAKGVQDSGLIVDDTDNLTGVASIDIVVGGDLQINSTSVLNATTLGAAIVASSLTSVGTITSGTWSATDVDAAAGGTGRSSHTAFAVICGGTTSTAAQQSIAGLGSSGEVLTSNGAGALPTFSSAGAGDVTAAANMTDNSIIRGDGGVKGVQDSSILIDDSDNVSAIGTLGMGGDLTDYEAVNDGNPQIRLGATDAEELHIQSVYDGGAQTLDYVLLQTDAASATANKGLFRFNVDGSDILDVDDGGIDLDTGGAISIAGTDILDATTLGSAVVASSLTSVGTITSGTWQGTTVAVDQGGTGSTSLNDGFVLLGSGTGAITALDVTTKGSILVGDDTTDPIALAVGTNGQVLTAASGETSGLNWTTVSGTGDVTAAANMTDHSIVRGDGGAKGVQDSGILIDDSDNVSAIGTLGIGGDLTNFEAVNDGSPQIRLGSSDTEELHIQSVYDTGAQTLDFVLLQTDVVSATGNKGLFRFNVDGSDILDIDDGGIDLDTGGAISIAGTDVLNATTLGSAVVASSLTSVGTITSGVWTGTDVAAADGGTGRSSHTAHAVICGGTTSTAAQQSIAGLGSSGQVLTSNGAGALPTFQASGAGVIPDSVMGGTASSHNVNTTTAFAPIEYVDLGTVEINVRTFDPTTEEYMQGTFVVPADMDTTGTITFEVQGWATTVHASNNLVAFRFGHRAIADSEAIDGTYTNEDSGDLTTDAVQDDLDIFTWTETRANLGWVAGDMILYRFSRIDASATELASDYRVYNFFIRIPRD